VTVYSGEKKLSSEQANWSGHGIQQRTNLPAYCQSWVNVRFRVSQLEW